MKRKLWAIADLHLGFSTGKWMDKFGEHWIGHHKKVEKHWRDSIDDNDIVLLPGDFSWAMKPAQVEEEFKWLRDLPGIMVMIKGNHDYWWPGSHKKMKELLPERTYALKKTATMIGGLPIVGVRGGDLVPFGKKTQEDVDKELEREIKEFKASIAHLDELEKETQAVHPRVAMFHYPPFGPRSDQSIFTDLIEEANCKTVVYGHLHSKQDWDDYFQGEARGVQYHLVACDALDFKPLLIDEWED